MSKKKRSEYGDSHEIIIYTYGLTQKDIKKIQSILNKQNINFELNPAQIFCSYVTPNQIDQFNTDCKEAGLPLEVKN